MDVIKNLLQGRWLGHPLHPLTTHLPTALFPASLLFDLLSRASDQGRAYVVTGDWCIAVGLLAVLLAAPTGLADFTEIKPDKPARKLAIIHAALNVLVTLLFLVTFFIRAGGADSVGIVPITLSVIANGTLVVAGWIGGRLIYHYGISVARFSKDEWRRVAEAGGAQLPPPQ